MSIQELDLANRKILLCINSVFDELKNILFSVQLNCRKDDLEAGLMLLSQAKQDGVTPNLVMCKCIIGKFAGLSTFSF